MPGQWSRAGEGAASGAAAGSVAGPWGAAAGGVIGGLAGYFSSDPYSAEADKYQQYQQYLQSIGKYLGPLEKDYTTSDTAMRGLVSHPNELVDSIMSRYHASPFATDLTKSAQQAATAAAVSQGYQGTPQEQEAVGQKVGEIADASQQQYLGNVLGTYREGLGGLSSYAHEIPGLLTQQVSGEGQYLGNMGGLAAGQAAWRNQGLSGLGGAAGTLFGEYMKSREPGPGFMQRY